MVSIILASHGTLAEGVRQAAEMIMGAQEGLATVSLTPDMGPDELRAQLLACAGTSQQVLCLVDLWGGTPFNQIQLLVGEPDRTGWAALSGLNLPMLIAALTERTEQMTAAELASGLVDEARAGIRLLPEAQGVVRNERQAVDAASVPVKAPAQPIMEESVGSGRMQVVLARVDTRLLHGQVATAWTKATSPDRIIVCSDGVAHDELRKSMIEQAAPPGVRAHVVPIQKLIEVARDPRFGKTRAMLLFETPQDLLRALEGGVGITQVNLGSMAHSAGKAVVTNVLAMDADDIETLERIAARGVKIDVRKVPSDTSASFESVMQKAHALVG